MEKKSVLFVCLGNTCRSPMAQAIFINLLKNYGLDQWVVDSAGTADYHVGKSPNSRTMETLVKHGINDFFHISRQVFKEPLTTELRKNYIFRTLENIAKRIKEPKAKIISLSEYDPEGELEIPDPYCARDMAVFDQIYQQIQRCCTNFLETYKK